MSEYDFSQTTSLIQVLTLKNNNYLLVHLKVMLSTMMMQIFLDLLVVIMMLQPACGIILHSPLTNQWE